jgi:hypothetical protein
MIDLRNTYLHLQDTGAACPVNVNAAFGSTDRRIGRRGRCILRATK